MSDLNPDSVSEMDEALRDIYAFFEEWMEKHSTMGVVSLSFTLLKETLYLCSRLYGITASKRMVSDIFKLEEGNAL